MRPLRTGQRQVLNWFTTAGLAVSTSSSSQFFVQIFFFFFFYSVLKFTFSFLLRTCWRAWSRDLLPPLSIVPRSKGTENWRSDASFWYLNETRTRCFSRAAKQNDKTGKKKKKSWGKKMTQNGRRRRIRREGEELRNVSQSRSIWDRVRTGNSVGCDIYTDWLWLLSLCYSIDSRRMSRQRSLFSLLLLYFILIFFFPFFHFPFSPLKKPPLRHSMNIGWKRSRNSLRIIPPSTTTHTKFFEWVKQDNNEPIMK